MWPVIRCRSRPTPPTSRFSTLPPASPVLRAGLEAELRPLTGHVVNNLVMRRPGNELVNVRLRPQYSALSRRSAGIDPTDREGS